MITIKGITLNEITIDVDENKIKGNYSIISSLGKVIAKQGFNSYSDITVNMSSETKKLVNRAVEAVDSEIEETLGLKGGDTNGTEKG